MKTWTNPTIEELDVKLTAHGNSQKHCEQCWHAVGNSGGSAANGHGGVHGGFEECIGYDDPGTPLS